MLARDLASTLSVLHKRYKAAVEFGELGAAICAREEIGKLVVREMFTILTVFKFFEDPLHAQDDNQLEVNDEIPF